MHFVAESVDSLIEVAVRNRPELATARAQASAAQSQIRVARSASLPSLTLSATGASNSSNVAGYAGRTYLLNFGVQVPVFTGFSNQYDAAGGERAVPGGAGSRGGRQAAGHSTGVHGVLHASHVDRSRSHVARSAGERHAVRDRRTRAVS